MHQKIIFGLLIFLSAILEVSFLGNILPGKVAADLVLITTVVWISGESFKRSWLWGMTAGLLLDIISLSLVGLNGFSFVLVFWVLGFLSKRFFLIRKKKVFLTSIALILAGAMVHYFLFSFIFWAAENFSGQDVSFLEVFVLKIFLFKILNNFLVILVVFWPVSKIKNTFFAGEGRLEVR